MATLYEKCLREALLNYNNKYFSFLLLSLSKHTTTTHGWAIWALHVSVKPLRLVPLCYSVFWSVHVAFGWSKQD